MTRESYAMAFEINAECNGKLHIYYDVYTFVFLTETSNRTTPVHLRRRRDWKGELLFVHDVADRTFLIQV